MEQVLAELALSWNGVQEPLHRILSDVEAVDVKMQSLMEKLQIASNEINDKKHQMEQERKALQEMTRETERLRAELDEEKTTMLKVGAGNNDLIGLNFGGERTVTVKRSLLLQFEGSTLAAMFSGRYDHQLDHDKEGNVFLDYSPSVMVPLIDFLRLYRDAPKDVQLPSPPDIEAWVAMLDFFGLKDIFQPTTTFSGIRTNVPINSLRGWTQFFCKPYSHPTTLADFVPPVQGNALLMGARKAGSDVLAVAAMGHSDVITSSRQYATTKEHNGVYWYCFDSKSVGFAPNTTIIFSPADAHDKSCGLRLSWHLNGNGGYRVGNAFPVSSTEWEKVIFVASVSLGD